MINSIFQHLLDNNAILQPIITVIAIIITATIFRVVFKYGLLRFIKLLVSKQSPELLTRIESVKIFNLISIFAPITVIYLGVKHFLDIGNIKLESLLLNLILIWLIMTFFLFINAVISFILTEFSRRTIVSTALVRTFNQLIKIVLFVTGSISVVSILINKSPVVIFSSLGALTAILLLVFKDSILGFVASIQVSLLKIVKEGDWIEMPKYNADGTILDINISSIRVQNWDKTITTIPTYALVSEPVKNWQGMESSNCRRIKRKIHLDIKSIQFCDDELLEKCRKINHLNQYLNESLVEISNNNKVKKNNDEQINIRALTNIGLFRNYLNTYIKEHPKINNQATILIRQLQSNEYGVPIEVYCFTSTTDWIEYEAIQSDIFDHIFSILDTFKLRPYQLPVKLAK